MVIVVIYFFTKKKCIITKYSNEKIYDVNLLYIKYLSKNHFIKTFLVDNKYFDFLKATHFQELESQ